MASANACAARQSKRTVGLVSVAALLALASPHLMTGAGASAPTHVSAGVEATDSGGDVTATYSGSFQSTVELTVGSATTNLASNFTWSETEVAATTPGNPLISQQLTLSGSETASSSNGDPSTNCSATLSAAPTTPGRIYFSEFEDDGTTVAVSPYLPDTDDAVANGTGLCAELFGEPAGDLTAQWNVAANPMVQFPVSQGQLPPQSYPVNYSGPFGSDGAEGTAQITVTDTLTASNDVCPVDSSSGSTSVLDGVSSRVNQRSMATVQKASSQCLSILWTNDPDEKGKAVDVTDKTNTVWSGQHVVLKVEGSGVTSSSGTWTVSGSPVAMYDVDYPAGRDSTVEPLTDVVNTQTVSFYWYRSDMRTDDIQVKVPSGLSAYTHFQVEVPTSAFKATTCGAAIISKGNSSHRDLGLPAFGLGLNDTCTTPGISWSASITAPAGSALGDPHGSIGVIQLIDDSLSHNNRVCVVPGAGKGLSTDQHTFYGGGPSHAGVLVNFPENWQSNDSPAETLKNRVGIYKRAFIAEDYLMFKLGGLNGDSIWVPLRRMVWNWDATAVGTLGGLGDRIESWEIKSAHNPEKALSGSIWDKLPTWTWVSLNDNDFKCP